MSDAVRRDRERTDDRFLGVALGGNLALTLTAAVMAFDGQPLAAMGYLIAGGLVFVLLLLFIALVA